MSPLLHVPYQHELEWMEKSSSDKLGKAIASEDKVSLFRTDCPLHFVRESSIAYAGLTKNIYFDVTTHPEDLKESLISNIHYNLLH